MTCRHPDNRSGAPASRSRLGVGSFFVVVSWFLCGAAAGTFTAFGPQNYLRDEGEPVTVLTSFPILNPNTQYVLQIYNGGLVDGEFERVSSSVIMLNGAPLFGPEEFNQGVAFLEKPVPLNPENVLSVELRGEPGGGITILIVGVDNEPPSITAQISPQPNAGGWNNSDVTVTFDCADAISGVASCPEPVTVTVEGEGQSVTGTATDRAGNTASVTVTVSLDRTPPAITPVRSPPPNANGWNRTDVSVSFTCADALSGVTACPDPVLVVSEGADQEVQGTAADRAGNTASVTLAVNLDRTPPAVSPVVSPAPNAAGWHASDVTVSFSASDDLSGVEFVTSPVTLTEEGAGLAVTGGATDRAGNGATTTALVNLDRTAPSLDVTGPSGTVIGDSTPEVTLQYADPLSGIDAGSVRVSVGGNLLAGCTAGPTSASCETPPLTSGDYSVVAQIADVAGNLVGRVHSFTLSLATPLDVTITGPATGHLTRELSVEVTGTLDPAAETVTVNGVAAVLGGGVFVAAGVPLIEGNNALTAVATNAAGGVGTATVTVVRDTTPPTVLIESPAAGQVVTSSTVAVVGLVNDIVTGTVNAEDCRVVLTGRAGAATASIANRTFMVEMFPLVPGPNTITAVATDAAGNSSPSFHVQVIRQDLAGQRIRAVTTGNLVGTVNGGLGTPLVAELISATGAPVPGRNVTFAVTRGDGTLTSGGDSGRTLTLPTDAMGRADVSFTLGSRAGVGNQRVTATAVGFVGEVVFMASALNGPPTAIKTFMGEMQAGAVGRPLPDPFIVFVHDAAGNPVQGVPVTFQVTAGGGNIGGSPSAVVPTDGDGRAKIALTLGPEPGISNNLVEAGFPGLAGLPAVLTATALPIGPPEATRLSGVVLDNSNVPVPNATITVDGTALQAVTNENGRFSIGGVPVGTLHFEVDATTTTRPGTWPVLHFVVTTVSGQDNTIGMPIFVLTIDTPSARIVGGPEDVTLNMSNVAGVELTVFANSVTCLDGSHQCAVSISQVHNDKVPMPPLEGAAPRLIWTVQPPGTRFDPPARIAYPNVDGLPPGAVTEIFSFDHDLGQYVSVGTGTVSDDGSVITSDPGGGIAHAGWGYPRPAPVPLTCLARECSPDADVDPLDCVVPLAGDPCSNEGCQVVSLPDTNPCGTTLINPFVTTSAVRRQCGFCSDGLCLLGLRPPPEAPTCDQSPGSPELFRCQINKVFIEATGVPALVTFANEGTHSGQVESIYGCAEEGTDISTCGPVSKSWHYCDRAFDLRSRDKCLDLSLSLAELLNQLPGGNAKVEFRGRANEHIHVEFRTSGSQCRNGIVCGGVGQEPCLVCSWIRLLEGENEPPGATVQFFDGARNYLMCEQE